MDKRILKTGYIRLRFKLSEKSYQTIQNAIKQSKAKFDHVGLDLISLDFISGNNLPSIIKGKVIGNKRFLVRLYPDQYETLMIAFEIAKEHVTSDEEALVVVCKSFLKTDKQFLV